jgi:uncharacterized BrkB/YihY/UPF0761 family membrane protein
MRRGMWIVVAVLVILGAIAVGVTAYNAGVAQGIEESGRAGEVVRVVGPGGWGFPFGFLLFPLFFIGFFFLLRAAFWGRRWGGPGPGGRWGSRDEMVEQWHRRLHERDVQSGPSPGGEPTSV